MAGYGAMVRAARKREGWTQQELADRVGTTSYVISNLEREVTPPDPELTNAIVRALRLSAEDFLTAMGFQLTPPVASHLPREAVLDILRLTAADQVALWRLIAAMARGNTPAEQEP